MKKFVLGFVLAVASVGVFAQRFSGFSGDISLTPIEVKDFMATVSKDRQKEADDIAKQFEKVWTSGVISSQVQQDFIEVANHLVNKKMRPIPHFAALWSVYQAFSTNEDQSVHNDWKKMADYIIDNEQNNFVSIMDNFTHFFQEKYIYYHANVKWRIDGSIDKIGLTPEPYISFKKVDLIGASKTDSLTVINTSGKFYPLTDSWSGTAGEVNWERAGLGENVKAKLLDYKVTLKFAALTAENVSFYYPRLFAAPLKGTLEEKATHEVSEEKATYPRFKSYDNTIAIKNVYENVDYIGGFEMRGASIMGSSVSENSPALLLVRNSKGKLIVKAQSYHFLLRPEAVLAESARISIYFEQDSLYHPAANLKYSDKSKELVVSRTKEGVGRSPFFDSYHKMDIYAESIQWKTEEERIEIRPIVGLQSPSPAIFESQNYYDPSVMRQVQGFNDENPLYQLWELFNNNKLQPLKLETVSRYFKRELVDIKRLMIDLAARGFVEYDVINNELHYRRKMTQYLNNAVNVKDYDNIVLESKTHFATIDLVTNKLNITGCEFFVLSDAQIVNVYPTDERVTVKKNRDMSFSGKIIAGLFDFASHQCEFKYDDFNVEMNVVDTMVMYVEDMNAPTNVYQEHKLRRIKSVIEELSGTLYIDVPGNKCGRIDYPDYPMFEARKGGKVFYDAKSILGGVYTRDQFSYALDRFVIKNLDNFSIDSMKFAGRLISGGIFEDIPEPLQIRPDYSLGFIYKTPPSGATMYGNKGNYHNIIDLSNQGLRGKGTIDYMTSASQADDYIFYIDSTNGNPSTHVVAPQMAGTEYPPASVKDSRLHWEPYKDQMFVFTKQNRMDIFGETKLTGNSKITPSGMYGSGLLDFKRADVTSHNFTFKHHEMLADSSDLQIYMTEDKADKVFTTDNYLSDVNFQTRKGTFTSQSGFSEVFFIRNEYKARASYFEWDPIDLNVIRFKWDDPYARIDINSTSAKELMDMTSQGNELIATCPTCKGLTFNAVTANFDFGTNIINCTGVRYVDVGDAAVIPDNGKITIRAHADMDMLSDARIVAGRPDKYHEMYDCLMKITSKMDMRGSGKVDYIDETDRKQTISLDSIWFYQQTKAIGKIPADKNFMLSPHFGFDGRIELNSKNQFLYFVGGVEIVQHCDGVKYARLRILQQVDPKNIYLEVHNRSKDVADRKAVIAIASANKTGRIYTCFGAAKEQFNDAEYISVFGYITYNHSTNEFWAASMAKLEDPTVPGNMIKLDKYNCITTGTGAIDMGTKLGRVDFKTSGTVINYMKVDSAVMNLSASLNFFFSEQAMKVMNSDIDNSYALDFFDPYLDDNYEQALYDMLGEAAYQKYQAELAKSGRVKKIPEALNVKFLFSDVNFVWDKHNAAFISQTKLHLVMCDGKEVDKIMPGRLVIEKKGSKNRFYFYTEFDDQFYFFQFENNTMYGFSSNTDFNGIITSISPEKRTVKSTKELPTFTYKLGNKSQKNKFVKTYYQVIKEEPDTDY